MSLPRSSPNPLLSLFLLTGLWALLPNAVWAQDRWVQIEARIWPVEQASAPVYQAFWRWSCDSLGRQHILTVQGHQGAPLWSNWLPDPDPEQALDPAWWQEQAGWSGPMRPAIGDSTQYHLIRPEAFPQAAAIRLRWHRRSDEVETICFQMWGTCPIPGLRAWQGELRIVQAQVATDLPELPGYVPQAPGLGAWLIQGAQLPAGRGTLYLAPLWRIAGFTPMSGFFLEDSAGYQQPLGRKGFLSAGFQVRYSLTDGRPGYEARLIHTPDPAWEWELSSGDIFRQFHPQADRFGNSPSTLLLGGNLIRTYRERFIGARLRWRPHPDWQLEVKARRAFRENMPIISDFYLWGLTRPYTDNLYLSPHFQREVAFSLSWQAGQRWLHTPKGYRPGGSRAPMLQLSLIRAFPRQTGDADYWHLQAGISSARRKQLPGLRWQGLLRGGWYPGARRVYLSDYVHFKGNETFVRSGTYDEFLLLPFYQASAPLPYLEGHIEHRFPPRPLGQRQIKSPVYFFAGFHGLWQRGRTPWLEAMGGIEIRALGLLPVRLDVGLLLLGETPHSRMLPLVSALPQPAYRP